jgi:hypothetical protein
MIVARAKTSFDAATIKKKVDAASFRSLGHAGGAIRLTARRSIRRRKKPSIPGTPPHTQSGRLKRSIRYEATKQDVKIGPVNEIGGKLWNLHEFGGVAKGRRRLKAHRFSPGEFGPIRVKTAGFNASFHRAKLTTWAQANRATRLINEENQRRQTQVRRYPKRPFMGPALEINRPRLPKFWADSVK